MHPEIQQGEVGPATLCVAHSIRIFGVWPPSLLFLPTPGGYIFSWCFYGFLPFKFVFSKSFLWCFYGGLSFSCM